MALDGIFLYHLKNEIEKKAVGSRVDKIHQPSRDEIVISLRSREGNYKLLLSCNADSARIHFTDFPPENPSKPPMFCLMLRKRLTGAWLDSIEQDNLERILRLNFSGTDELADKTNFSLVIASVFWLFADAINFSTSTSLIKSFITLLITLQELFKTSLSSLENFPKT